MNTSPLHVFDLVHKYMVTTYPKAQVEFHYTLSVCTLTLTYNFVTISKEVAESNYKEICNTMCKELHYPILPKENNKC